MYIFKKPIALQKPYPDSYISEDLKVINIFFPKKDRQITQQTSRRPVQNSNIGVAGNSNFEDDDDFFNNVDMPEDVPLQRVAPKSGLFWQEFVRWKFKNLLATEKKPRFILKFILTANWV